ncbi:MAG: hypothetical protein IT162_04450 [Bryobacterales bacterium]|nr:hypothetical protein [Bryobacterales bacterium]
MFTRSSFMTYSVVVYRCRNLGDMIQTLALTRLLPQAHGVYRHRLADAPAGRTLVLNGMLDKDAPPPPGAEPPCVLAGVSGPHFRKQAYLRWMKESGRPVGARDRQTVDGLTAAGIAASLIGCATLTLPRYDGPRRGVYSVDCAGPGQALTHTISRELAVPAQWSQAMEILERYRTAEAVHTSRLHVALPCLAFGTPVWIADPQRGGAWHPYRFSLLDELGIRYETLVTADVTPMARRYEAFLADQLGHAIQSGEPKMPVLPPDPGPPRWRIPWP